MSAEKQALDKAADAIWRLWKRPEADRAEGCTSAHSLAGAAVAAYSDEIARIALSAKNARKALLLRVAEGQARFDGRSLTDMPAADRKRYMQRALLAVQEMRSPSAKMLRAAGAAMSPAKRPTEKRVSERAKHGIRYRAMIDAALADATPNSNLKVLPHEP